MQIKFTKVFLGLVLFSLFLKHGHSYNPYYRPGNFETNVIGSCNDTSYNYTGSSLCTNIGAYGFYDQNFSQVMSENEFLSYKYWSVIVDLYVLCEDSESYIEYYLINSGLINNDIYVGRNMNFCYPHWTKEYLDSIVNSICRPPTNYNNYCYDMSIYLSHYELTSSSSIFSSSSSTHSSSFFSQNLSSITSVSHSINSEASESYSSASLSFDFLSSNSILNSSSSIFANSESSDLNSYSNNFSGSSISASEIPLNSSSQSCSKICFGGFITVACDAQCPVCVKQCRKDLFVACDSSCQLSSSKTSISSKRQTCPRRCCRNKT
jgi:hypothetical protein